MTEKIKIDLPIIVEGKYDKNTLLQIFDATVITTGGFGVFNSKEKQIFLRRLAERGGVILLADSDGGGRQIRSFLSGILPREKIHNLYIPEIAGKERRKRTPSKAGMLGVEGMSREVLLGVFAPFISGSPTVQTDKESREVTKTDLYLDGLSGREDSSKKREALARLMNLPHGMSANALLEAINLFYTRAEYKKILESVEKEEE